MITGRKLGQISLMLLLLWAAGCKKDSIEPALPVETTTNTTTATNGSINSWVYGVMQDAYFWTNQLPAQNSLQSSQSPFSYFESLIYQRNSVDRFSSITDDIDALKKEFNGVSKVFGIQYQLSYVDQSQTNIGLFLSQVVKGSPAEAAGLHRGDIIMKVNGQLLTNDNYATLLRGNDNLTVTLGTINGSTFVPDDLKTFSLTKAEISENPIAFSSIIDKSPYGKKIGYLVYTQFVPGTEASPKLYDDQLRNIFSNFKANGVNELVLDLRFNGGGYISSAETLASLVGTNISASKVFYEEQWNDRYNAYLRQQDGPAALDHNFLTEPSNIGTGLTRVFVLTSRSTASASELVINGLKPYMSVITIGNNTYGKNLFGTLIEDDQKRWKWGFYVMLGQTANVNGESDYGNVNGISPTYKVDDNRVPFRSFGDDNEPLFNKVLSVMGIPASTTARVGATNKVTPLSNEFLRDNLQTGEKRMIQESPFKK